MCNLPRLGAWERRSQCINLNRFYKHEWQLTADKRRLTHTGVWCWSRAKNRLVYTTELQTAQSGFRKDQELKIAGIQERLTGLVRSEGDS